jgi:hypothetical protein
MHRSRTAVLPLAFVLSLTIRVWAITRNYGLFDDQIRDWTIALGPLNHLPFVGISNPAGRQQLLGPAFYWVLWAMRVTLGPWFENLPHAAGVGEAILHAAGDALLLAGIWRRTGSARLAVAATVLVAIYDLQLPAMAWSPAMAVGLAKLATAVVLLGWPRRSSSSGASGAGVAGAAAIAWCAVQCDASMFVVALGVFAALLAMPLHGRDYIALRRTAWIIAVVVAILQVPHAVHRAPAGLAGSGPSVTGATNVLVPATLMLLLLAAAAATSTRRASQVVVVTITAAVAALVPGGLRPHPTAYRMSDYGVLLDGSRKIARLKQPMRAIRTELGLAPAGAPEFLHTILAGPVDPKSGWVALIKADGSVVFQQDGAVTAR